MNIFSKLKEVTSCILVFVFLIFSCGGCQNSNKQTFQSGSSSSDSKSSSKENFSLKKDVVLKYKNYEVSLDEYMCILTDYLAMLCETGVEINSEKKSMAIHKYSLTMAKQSVVSREKLQEIGKDISEERKKTIQASVDENFFNRSFNEDRAKSLKITKKGLEELKADQARLSAMVYEGLEKVDEPYEFDVYDDDTIMNFDVLDSIDVSAQAKVVLDIVKQKKNSGQKCNDLNGLLAL